MGKNKVKLEFVFPNRKVIEYNSVEIQVDTFLTTSQQVFLINRYIEEYFQESSVNFVKSSEYSYLTAEYNMINYIFQLLTNVDTDNLDDNIYSDSVLLNNITSSIVNYFDFRNKLNFIINEIKQQNVLNSSIGIVLSDLIDKAYGILDKFSDISPEQLEKAREDGLSFLKRLEKSTSIIETKKK